MAFDKTNAVESIDTWRRQARVFFKRLGRKIDHEAVVEHAREEGQTSGRYVFMAVMSCAIATLGLLRHSTTEDPGLCWQVNHLGHYDGGTWMWWWWYWWGWC